MMMLSAGHPAVRKTGALLALTLFLGAVPVLAQQPTEETGEAARLATEAQKLVTRLDQRQAEIEKWEELRERFQGDDRRAADLELENRRLEALGDLHALAENVAKQEALGLDVKKLRARVEPAMREVPTMIRERIEETLTSATELRARRDEASPDQLLDLEQQVAREEERIQRLIRVFFDHLEVMKATGQDTTAEQEYLETGLGRFANLLSRQIELALVTRKEVEQQIQKQPDDTALAAELSAIEKRLESSVASLRSSLEIMKKLGLDTTEQHKLIARTTGDIVEMLDTEVAIGLIGHLLLQIRAWASENGVRLLLKGLVILLILLGFRVLAGMARRVVVRALATSKVAISKLLENMITSMVRRAVMILGLLVALSQAGVSLGPILAGLGVAGFVVGFALQDTLSNFAAGMMILFYRPFDVDDLVEAGGVIGKVSRMTLVSTTILTLDHQTLIVPNSKIWGDVIKNVTAQKLRRVDLTFSISYRDEIPKAERVLQEIVSGHSKVLKDPEPMIRLHNLGESSMDFIVRPWVAREDYWDVYWDLTREVKLRFDREGISIPFPQRDVHLISENAATA